MKKLFTSALLAFVLSINIYAQERTYFDENWEKATQDKMEYYRETSAKGQLTLIKDFYKNGTLQMEGMASDTTPGNEVFEGKVTWYTPEGKVMSMVTYSKGKQVGISQSYDVSGKLSEDMIYKADGTFSGKTFSYKDPENEYFYNSVTTYENSLPLKTIVYDEDIKGIRYETITDKEGKYEIKYYGEKGKYLGSSSADGETMLVEYYHDPMRLSKIEKYKSDGSIKEGVIYAKNGKILQEQKRNKKEGYKTTYDESGKKIGHLVYQYDKDNDVYTPMDGEDYQLNYDYTQMSSIDSYKNGSVILSKYFDESGKLVSEKSVKDDITQEIKYYSPDGKLKSTLTYKDDMPYNGTAYEGLNEIVYKDGIIVNTKNFSEDQKLNYEKKLNAKQTSYEATVYDNKGAVLYTFTQPLSEDGEDYYFTAQIVQYAKGKPANKSSVKAGVLQTGKIKLKTPNGTKELERNGKWILLKVYNTDGKLIQETKTLADAQDEYVSAENQTILSEDDLYYFD
ncbi:MAG: membrane-binding protein [Chryseobacterium sp.]|uniref:membrane-binding protein n=1 Tax=Chryseobacterium sp. TaxID=1871047 RepID=UPI0025BCC0E5|nr:membrane-binding protein [Chryseobacterium sp.]MCJ7935399.1 membrane-binding protein [Chryseobacterium sp.]